MKRLLVFAVLSVMLAGMTLSGTPVSATPGGNLVWNTFQGGGAEDFARDIGHDSAGNLYVVGTSRATWGTPIRGFSSPYEPFYPDDAFVAKFNAEGELVWNTFLGGGGVDEGAAIAVDGAGNTYVTGSSVEPWGDPVREFSGREPRDASADSVVAPDPFDQNFGDTFVVKLNADGALQWMTFLGGPYEFDEGSDVAFDPKGRVYVSGASKWGWGTPLRAYTGGFDVYVARLSPQGELNWNTFLGGSELDRDARIVLDSIGAAYVVGRSETTWGTPLRAFSGGEADGFIAKVGAHGVLKWNTFLGSPGNDTVSDIALDSKQMLYATGWSDAGWGKIKKSSAASSGRYVAKLGSDGSTKWNVFGVGGGPIALDSLKNIYLGDSETVMQLNPKGTLKWSTSIGGNGDDRVTGLTVVGDTYVYVAGYSSETWGTPKHPFTASYDAFVAKIQ